MQYNLAEMIDKEVTVSRVLKNPALAVKRKPTLEMFSKVIASDVEQVAIVKISRQFEEMFKDCYDEYSFINGLYEDIPDHDVAFRDNWETGLDDAVEKVIEPFMPGLSQNWLGEHTIDTRIWTEEEQNKLARSMAKEIIKETYYGKEAGQMLIDAGFDNAELQVWLDQHLAGNTLTSEDDEMADITIEDVAMRIKARIGNDFDELNVYDDIEMMMDDDDILAEGAAARLGADKTDIELVRSLAFTLGGDAAQTFLDQIKTSSSADAAPPAKPTRQRKSAPPAPGASAPPAVPPVPGASPSVPKAAAPGAVDAAVLKLLKEHGSTKDTDFAATLGVSRATYNNWINGKTQFVPEAEQLDLVRAELLLHANGLLEAIALIDGTDPLEVN